MEKIGKGGFGPISESRRAQVPIPDTTKHNEETNMRKLTAIIAALGFLGFTNIHQMNGLKNINGMAINLVAAVMFIANGLVDWRLALLMAAGAIVGGYFGAGAARRIGQERVRRLIIFIGFALTAWLIVRNM